MIRPGGEVVLGDIHTGLVAFDLLETRNPMTNNYKIMIEKIKGPLHN